MQNVAQTNRSRGADWYTATDLAAIMRAVKNEGYPPQGRTGVGTVARRTTA